jgi:hypothetical protein
MSNQKQPDQVVRESPLAADLRARLRSQEPTVLELTDDAFGGGGINGDGDEDQ